MAYKCKICNKMIVRKKRQWKNNYLRYRNARICPNCLHQILNDLQQLKIKYNFYYRKMYPNYSYSLFGHY